jgi:hypothetical protein
MGVKPNITISSALRMHWRVYVFGGGGDGDVRCSPFYLLSLAFLQPKRANSSRASPINIHLTTAEGLLRLCRLVCRN